MFSSYRTRHMAPLILMPAVLFLAGPAAATEPSKEAQIEDALSAATPAIGATAKVMDEATDKVAIKRLLEEESFCALVEADRALLASPAEEQRARLVKLAWIEFENASSDDHDGAAPVGARRRGEGPQPAETLARGVIARSRRTARPGAAPTPPRAPAPAQAYDSLDAMTRRGAAALRRAVVEEYAVRHAAAEAVASAPTVTGAAATRAGEMRALALRQDADPACQPGSSRSSLGAEPTPAAPDPMEAAPSADCRPAPITSLPRRPRAP